MMTITQIVTLLLLSLRTLSFQGEDENAKLRHTFDRFVKVYPADSASLFRFYFQWPSPREVQRDIEQMNALLQDSVQKQYQAVQSNLKPLLTKITAQKAVTRKGARNLVVLYTAYDKFQGKAMCMHILNDRENFDLVWKSFDVLASEAKRDTFFLAALISLARSIRTNAELAEAMPDFVWRSIQNNPEGFLQMYARRPKPMRAQWMGPWISEAQPDKSLREVFERISRSPGSSQLSKSAKELLDQIDGFQ